MRRGDVHTVAGGEDYTFKRGRWLLFRSPPI